MAFVLISETVMRSESVNEIYLLERDLVGINFILVLSQFYPFVRNGFHLH